MFLKTRGVQWSALYLAALLGISACSTNDDETSTDVTTTDETEAPTGGPEGGGPGGGTDNSADAANAIDMADYADLSIGDCEK